MILFVQECHDGILLTNLFTYIDDGYGQNISNLTSNSTVNHHIYYFYSKFIYYIIYYMQITSVSRFFYML